MARCTITKKYVKYCCAWCTLYVHQFKVGTNLCAANVSVRNIHRQPIFITVSCARVHHEDGWSHCSSLNCVWCAVCTQTHKVNHSIACCSAITHITHTIHQFINSIAIAIACVKKFRLYYSLRLKFNATKLASCVTTRSHRVCVNWHFVWVAHQHTGNALNACELIDWCTETNFDVQFRHKARCSPPAGWFWLLTQHIMFHYTRTTNHSMKQWIISPPLQF